MPDFSGLPLVIEPGDLLARLDAPNLIVVDLTSAARYDAGHQAVRAGRRVRSPTASQRSQAWVLQSEKRGNCSASANARGW